MDKTTREYAHSIAKTLTIDQGQTARAIQQIWIEGYLKAIEKNNVKQLLADNQSKDALIKELAEALDQIATGTHPYNEREAFSFVDTARHIAQSALQKVKP